MRRERRGVDALGGARWRGRKLSERTIQRFLVVAHASVTHADLALLLLRSPEVAR